MYFFSDNYIYEYGTDVYGEQTVSGCPERFIKDGDKNTYWESEKTNPSLTINLAKEHTIDSLWIKTANVSSFSLYYYLSGWQLVSGSPINKGNGVWFFFKFPEIIAKDWQIRFVSTGNTRVYELFLMKSRLIQESDDNLPSKVDVTINDIASVEHILADGQTIVYSGRRAYAEISIEYQFTPRENRDALYLLYSLPYLRSVICVLPDSDYPEGIYRCVWIDKSFPLIYSISYKGAGFSGVIRLRET